jgi:hypothetical protein
MMRRLSLLLVLSLITTSAALAAEIREFDLTTVAQLGREMNRVSQRADKGATDAVRKRAQQTAVAALKGRLFKTHYDFLVVSDPDGSGFLVYAMPASSPTNVVLGGNFRVTVSADGTRAERVDAMARSILPAPKPPKGADSNRPVSVSMSQIVSSRALETCVYTSLHDSVIVSVGMVNDNAKVWVFVGDKIFEMTPELLRSLGIEDKKRK